MYGVRKSTNQFRKFCRNKKNADSELSYQLEGRDGGQHTVVAHDQYMGLKKDGAASRAHRLTETMSVLVDKRSGAVFESETDLTKD